MDEVGMNGIMNESPWMKLEWMVSCINLYGWSWNEWYHEWISMDEVGMNPVFLLESRTAVYPEPRSNPKLTYLKGL